uniref:Uncharacterized protein n=1 Tax=Urocitellus parryii TaxID=9999 RepID=A0A8D2KGB1_UROPR
IYQRKYFIQVPKTNLRGYSGFELKIKIFKSLPGQTLCNLWYCPCWSRRVFLFLLISVSIFMSSFSSFNTLCVFSWQCLGTTTVAISSTSFIKTSLPTLRIFLSLLSSFGAFFFLFSARIFLFHLLCKLLATFYKITFCKQHAATD